MSTSTLSLTVGLILFVFGLLFTIWAVKTTTNANYRKRMPIGVAMAPITGTGIFMIIFAILMRFGFIPGH